MKWLVFQHVPHEHPGLITTFAKENNISLDVIKLWEPYTLPSLADYDALLIMGGPMGVYEGKDTYPSKEDELRIIKENLGKKPMLCFCLGSQLLAAAMGAAVHPNLKDGKVVKETGYYPIDLTTEGKANPIFHGFTSPTEVMLWHGDAFDLPAEGRLLASSQLCTNQAFSYKNAYGLLFHFEFTPEMVVKQIEMDRDWIHAENNVDESKLIQEAKEKEILMKEQSDKLLRNFVTIITGK